MSSTAVATPLPATRGVSERTGLAEAPKDSRRSERSAGKGRRRRAAAEQRRIEQQRWGQYLDDEEDPVVVPTPGGNRRRMRRSRRRNSARDDLEDYLAGNLDSDFSNTPSHGNDATELDVALALSLSLSESAASGSNMGVTVLPDMSYETLVMLENVKCVVSAEVVESLRVCAYSEKERPDHEQAEEVCAICQCDYEDADLLIKLPCTHKFHHGCGSEWLLNYSKLCPVCKHDVTE
ncbi:hypothetical protein MPTK1_4g20830 [Marchantia polymorpha subsp. ruderalis]|uniref:RING-type domain-containing protein n=2 Tax=Marchantia polymorpha TaxID=3197 RepID=A0AAF6BC43_MARPO|nr:hypothetical protein MARPO_0101s0029 [Marchantia polymorpha]BBN09577.1 hypothetical protein Mp_4g20830 [Marchantia polymorpha subsp. ruderalis]|eukprot:PTQ32237.1 hypothetical protein MARPO_0101s0029 [Marchantia polymorpha]